MREEKKKNIKPGHSLSTAKAFTDAHDIVNLPKNRKKNPFALLTFFAPTTTFQKSLTALKKKELGKT